MTIRRLVEEQRALGLRRRPPAGAALWSAERHGSLTCHRHRLGACTCSPTRPITRASCLRKPVPQEGLLRQRPSGSSSRSSGSASSERPSPRSRRATRASSSSANFGILAVPVLLLVLHGPNRDQHLEHLQLLALRPDARLEAQPRKIALLVGAIALAFTVFLVYQASFATPWTSGCRAW